MLQCFLRPSIGLPLLFITLYFLYRRWTAKPRPSIPVAGLRKEWFAEFRCQCRTTFDFEQISREAYENYSAKGLPCIISSLASERIVLPPTFTDWIVGQPDEVLDSKVCQRESLQTDYTLSSPNIARTPYHEFILRKDMTRQLGNLTLDIMDELTLGFDETWGLDTEAWKNINLYDNMSRIVGRTSNRVFVGSPLCRNESYLAAAGAYARDIAISAVLIHRLPPWLRPVVALFVTIPNRIHLRQFRKHLDPEIMNRLRADPEKKGSTSPPNDLLQWSINYAAEKLPREELTPKNLASRMAIMNFAAIHTSSIAICDTIFDLLSSDPSKGYLQELREEAETILAEEGGIWSKKALAKMHKTDSAIRESMRFNSFMAIGLARRVMPEEGITAPEGTHLPHGSEIALCLNGIHADKNNYTNPTEYDLLRYVRQRESTDSSSEGDDSKEYLRKANLTMVSTAKDYQVFGLGKHACPGRFFAANELKLLLAYMVLNYDIEPLKERPQGTWVGTVLLPSTKACIRVRRRKTSASL